MNFIFGVENNIEKQSFYLSPTFSQEADISGGLKSLPHLWLTFILVIKYPVSRGPSLQHKIIGLHPRVATLNSAVLPLLGGWAVVSVNWTYCAHICVFWKQLSQHLWVANVWGEASQDNLLFKKCYTFTTWKKEKKKAATFFYKNTHKIKGVSYRSQCPTQKSPLNYIFCMKMD